jgi:O-succinylbenzoate synthase
MIEQPLWNDDIYYHAQLQRLLKTAVCLDESIVDARSARVAVELKACRIMNIKVGRIGGFNEAIAVHDICEKSGIPVWCGGMLESGIGRAQNIALSSLQNFTLPGDVSASRRYWKEDIVDPEITVSPRGTITQLNLPGSGYRVKEKFIEELTARKEEMRARSLSVPVATRN